MNTRPHMTLLHAAKGFTITELLIVVSIIGILSMIALPAYQEHGRKVRRSDAKVALMNAAQAMERCNIQYNAYNDSTNCAFPLANSTNSITTDGGFYTIAATTLTATTFTLKASPITGAGQDDDSGCTSFSINQAGTKTATGSDSSNCW